MQNPKMSRKEREHLRHRGEILKSALELFAERGFHSVTMDEIAKESEFAVGTLYKFFRNKEDLYRALVLEKSEEFHKTVIKAIEDGEDEMDSIKRYLEGLIGVVMKNLKFVRLYLAETRGASFNFQAGLDEEVRRMRDLTVGRLADVFKRGIKKKVFKSFDPHLLANALDGIATALLLQALYYGDHYSFDANTIIRIFFEGILLD